MTGNARDHGQAPPRRVQVDLHPRLLSLWLRPWSAIICTPTFRLVLKPLLDLPYMYSTEGKLKEPNVAADIGQGLLGIASSYAKKDMGGLLKGGLGILRAAGGGAQKAGEYTKRTRTSPADVVSMRLSRNIPWDLFGVVDLLEWLQGFSDERGYSGGWKSYGRYELRMFPSTSAV